jgi:Cu/Ag efflux pump CusA
MEKQSLYIPQGLKTRVEIFEGYGKEELFKTIIATVIAGVFDILLYLIFKNTVTSMVFILVAIFGSVMMLTKDKNNISVVDQVGFMVRFAKSQKVYRYKYLDEWGVGEWS